MLSTRVSKKKPSKIVRQFVMYKPVGLVVGFVIVALTLLACAEEVTPTPVATGPTPLSSPVATLSPISSATSQTTTVALASITPALPTASPSPTVTPTPFATSTTTPTPGSLTPTLTPTPLSAVPLQPVRRPGGTFKVGLLDASLKTQLYSPYLPDLSEVSSHLQRLVWGGRLLYLDPVRMEWRSLAATGLPNVDLDGRRYTFVLRDNLTWSDGRPIVPADYIYAFNNARLPENRFPRAADLSHLTLDTDPQNPRALIFSFDDRYATALEIISLIEPLPARLWSRYPFANPTQNPEITRPTVTSGLFRLDPTGLTFLPSTSYFLGQPNFDRVTLKSFKYRSELNDALKTGLINWSFEPFSGSDQLLFKGVNNLSVYSWLPQGADRRYIGYNLTNSFLQQREVRQNLNRLVDTRSLIVTVEKGLATPQTTFLPTNNEYALRIAQPPPFNPRQARDELKKLGYVQRDQDDLLVDPTGKLVPPLDLIYPNDVLEAQSIGVYLTQQYRQLGLQVTAEWLDPAVYLKRRVAGQYDLEIGLVHLPQAADPDDYKAQFVTKGSANFSGYSNSQVDSLFADGLHADPTQKSLRQPTYDRLQRLLQDDSPVFFLYTLQAYTVMSSPLDPTGGGAINLNGWQMLTWDAFPAYLNWYFRGT